MSKNKPLENIEDFCSFFERQLDVIKKLDVDWNLLPGSAPEDHQVRFYRKTLLIVGIDTLAGIRFPRAYFPDLYYRKNRMRFIRFLKEVAQWTEGESVSIPFLDERLDKANLGDGTLGRYLKNKLAHFDVTAGGQLMLSHVDEPAEQLLPYVTSEKEKTELFDLQHYSMLYRYRNSLVHGYREPGSAMEIDSLSSEPYYHSYTDDNRWFLVYPMQMFENIFRSSIQGLKAYLIKNGIDPYGYDILEETSRW
ncbi:MAG: hypothetical protein MUP30_11765 [Deltaproteobacteria bacterium]|nr:hypothetical protein [Deltaproteobacteria bacterium]